MIHDARRGLLAAALLITLGATAQAPGQAPGQHGSHEHGATAPSQPPVSAPENGAAGRAPLRVTMEEMHRHGGMPRGWKFSVPPGDPARGQKIFADLECYKCHAIKGESFPPAGGDDKSIGPELTGIGGAHPAEYIAESVLSPNRVIVLGPGFTGSDGLSIMPSFADSISLAQWVDLVAYLRSLTGGGDHHGGGEIARERVEGDYRVRLVYVAPGRPGSPSGGGHDHSSAEHDAHARAHHGGAAHPKAFVLDREPDEPGPYLPVTVTVHVAGVSMNRTVRLAPMVGDRGFHYGADIALPAGTERLTVGIGPTSMAVMVAGRKRFTRPVTAVFDWTGK